jgi:hypothetical protein
VTGEPKGEGALGGGAFVKIRFKRLTGCCLRSVGRDGVDDVLGRPESGGSESRTVLKVRRRARSEGEKSVDGADDRGESSFESLALFEDEDGNGRR